jgi:uncharacterized YigZ family protein
VTSPRHTLVRTSRHEVTIERSRFLATALPVDSPDTAMEALRISADGDATHNCWAYRIGDAYRSSDDGEPAGTAGRPILSAIDGQAMDRVVVVVTRWYGGIKLGAGGLVRAYGGTAAECLRLGEREPIVETQTLGCVIEFALEPALRALLPAFDAAIMEQRHDAQGAHLLLRVPLDRREPLMARLVDLSRGRVLFPSAD